MIRTIRLNIYPLSNEEIESFAASQESPELKEAYSQMADGCLKHPDKRIWYALWNIELNDGSKTVVGNLSFKGLATDGILEIGYGIASGYENRGYMTEAVTAITQWALRQDGIAYVEAETEATNIASKRVLEKSGFVLNGVIGDEGPRYVLKKD